MRREFVGGWLQVARLQPWSLFLIVVREETKLIQIRAGICQVPGGISVYLGPWRGDVFHSATCGGFCATLAFEDETTCPSIAFNAITVTRYAIFLRHLAGHFMFVAADDVQVLWVIEIKAPVDYDPVQIGSTIGFLQNSVLYILQFSPALYF